MELEKTEYIWRYTKLLFPILADNYDWKSPSNTVENKQYQQITDHVKSWNLSKTINNVILNKIEQRLREEVAPQFWNHFKTHDNSRNGFTQFYNAVHCLYEYFQKLLDVMNQLKLFRDTFTIDDLVYNRKDLNSVLILMLKSTLLSQLPYNYQEFIKKFYEIILDLVDTNEENTREECNVCSESRGTCNCLALFNETNRYTTALPQQITQPFIILCISEN